MNWEINTYKILIARYLTCFRRMRSGNKTKLLGADAYPFANPQKVKIDE